MKLAFPTARITPPLASHIGTNACLSSATPGTLCTPGSTARFVPCSKSCSSTPITVRATGFASSPCAPQNTAPALKIPLEIQEALDMIRDESSREAGIAILKPHRAEAMRIMAALDDISMQEHLPEEFLTKRQLFFFSHITEALYPRTTVFLPPLMFFDADERDKAIDVFEQLDNAPERTGEILANVIQNEPFEFAVHFSHVLERHIETQEQTQLHSMPSELLGYPDLNIRHLGREYMHALLTRNHARLFPLLLENTKHPDDSVRMISADLLRIVHPDPKATAEALAKTFQQDQTEPSMNIVILNTLSTLGEPLSQEVEQYIHHLFERGPRPEFAHYSDNEVTHFEEGIMGLRCLRLPGVEVGAYQDEIAQFLIWAEQHEVLDPEYEHDLHEALTTLVTTKGLNLSRLTLHIQTPIVLSLLTEIALQLKPSSLITESPAWLDRPSPIKGAN